jgi:hypothetical protein
MQIARRWDTVAKGATVAHLPIREALAMLAEPREPAELDSPPDDAPTAPVTPAVPSKPAEPADNGTPPAAAKQAPPKAKPAAKPTEPDEHPEYGANEITVDPVAEWEKAEREVERLTAVIASLQVDDTTRELAAAHAKYAQLNGRLMQETSTLNVARAQAQSHQRRLNRIAKLLNVKEWDDIIPAIEAMQALV